MVYCNYLEVTGNLERDVRKPQREVAAVPKKANSVYVGLKECRQEGTDLSVLSRSQRG